MLCYSTTHDLPLTPLRIILKKYIENSRSKVIKNSVFVFKYMDFFYWKGQVLNYQPFRSSIVFKRFLKHEPHCDFRAGMRRKQSWTLVNNRVPRVFPYSSPGAREGGVVEHPGNEVSLDDILQHDLDTEITLIVISYSASKWRFSQFWGPWSTPQPIP